MAENSDNLFTVRKGAQLRTENTDDEHIFLIDLEDEEPNYDAEKCSCNVSSEESKCSCGPKLSSSSVVDIEFSPGNIDENKTSCDRFEALPNENSLQKDVIHSDFQKNLSLSSNESFTICEECLSNRKKEFQEQGFTGPIPTHSNGSDNLNTSKEICICSKNEGVNEYNKKMADDCESQLTLKETITKESCNINCIPDEIMLKIFSYFSLPDLCRYVAPVCLSWLQYARDSTLWEVISQEEFKDVPSDLLVKVVTSWCSLLRDIDFRSRNDMALADFVHIFQSCPLIEKISFAFCLQIEDELVRKFSQYFHNLHYINFEGCPVSDAALIHLFGKPIHGLNLSHCTMITDEGVIFLARNFRNLTHINLDGIQWISHASIEMLVELHSNSLQEIVLDGAELNDDSVRLLTRCQNIRKLSLSFCDSLTDNSLEWLVQLKKLNYLQLKKGANFSTNGMLHLLHSLRTLEGKGLVFLDLAECTALSDECLRVISESCPNLQLLDLSWCWEVTDDGINFIFDSCHDITELYLCGLHELYGIPFRRTQAELPKLKYLDLRQCNKMSDDLLADLANQIKTLTILNYYGDVVKPSLNYWNLESKCSPNHFHHISFSR